MALVTSFFKYQWCVCMLTVLVMYGLCTHWVVFHQAVQVQEECCRVSETPSNGQDKLSAITEVSVSGHSTHTTYHSSSKGEKGEAAEELVARER